MRLVSDLEILWQRNLFGKYAGFQLTPVSIHIQFNLKRGQVCCVCGIAVTVCKDCIGIKPWKLFFTEAIVVLDRRLPRKTGRKRKAQNTVLWESPKYFFLKIPN